MADNNGKRKKRQHPLSEGEHISGAGKRVKFLGIWMPAVLIPHIKRFGFGGVVVVIFIIGMVFGINPITMMTGQDAGPPRTSSATMDVPLDSSEAVLGEFLRKVVLENEEMWSKTFLVNGLRYNLPEVRLTEIEGTDGLLIGADALEVSIEEEASQLTVIDDISAVGCGFGAAHFGPSHCPDTQTIYISMAYFKELRDRFGLTGNLAEAIELARQYGFHTQAFTDVYPGFETVLARGDEDEITDYSLKMSLQADCYAGIWAAWSVQGNRIAEGGVVAALEAAGQIDSETKTVARAANAGKAFGSGSIAQRQDWFSRGYNSAQVGKCDTFTVDAL